MARSMLDYGMTILEKVSFDSELFWKEYLKFCDELERDECEKLNSWVTTKFQKRDLYQVPLRQMNKN